MPGCLESWDVFNWNRIHHGQACHSSLVNETEVLFLISFPFLLKKKSVICFSKLHWSLSPLSQCRLCLFAQDKTHCIIKSRMIQVPSLTVGAAQGGLWEWTTRNSITWCWRKLLVAYPQSASELEENGGSFVSILKRRLLGSWVSLWFQQMLNASIFCFLALTLLLMFIFIPRTPLWFHFTITTQEQYKYSLFPTADVSLNTCVNGMLENKITNFEYMRKVFSEISRWIFLSKEEFCKPYF